MDFSIQLPSTWCHWCLQTSKNLDFLRNFLSNYCILPLASYYFFIPMHYDLVMLLLHDILLFSVAGVTMHLPPQISWNAIFHWCSSIGAKRSSWKDVILCNRWYVLEECNNKYSIDINARAHDEIFKNYCISVLQELYVFLCRYGYYST